MYLPLTVFCICFELYIFRPTIYRVNFESDVDPLENENFGSRGKYAEDRWVAPLPDHRRQPEPEPDLDLRDEQSRGLLLEDEEPTDSHYEAADSDYEEAVYTYEEDTGGSKKKSRLIWIGSFLLFLVVAGFFIQRIVYAKFDPGTDIEQASANTIELSIPAQSSTKQISELLENNGVIPSSTAFQVYLKLKGNGVTFQAGDYDLPQNIAVWDAIDKLSEGPKAVATDTAGFPEGRWVSEILPELDAALPSVTAAELQAVLDSGTITPRYRPEGVTSWEGLLFPAQYQFSEDVTAEEVIKKMNDEFNRTVAELGYDDPANLRGYSAYEVIIIASMIESEARFPDDRRKIAEVMYHRLSDVEPKNSWLGIDATVIYSAKERGLGSGEISRRNEDPDDPYNTSAKAGEATRLHLPPTPISSPGRASLEAALNPTDEGYSYYVLENFETGQHKFTSTKEDHDRAVANQPKVE